MLRPLRNRGLVCCLTTALLCAGAAHAADFLEPLSDGSAVELPAFDESIPTPAEHLGYPLGSRFTHHERIVHFLDRLAEASDRVTIAQYGSTYEGRPLKLLAISTPENLARLDEIQAKLRRLSRASELSDAELERELASAPVAVWLAYGVHGNESSSAEAAMAAAYVFAAGQGEWPELLENAVILIDPLSNPDGRERYVHFFETKRGRVPDGAPWSAEHAEPWPGGRRNHYLIDLNRDWAWISQRETSARIAAYRSWEPQVHVDLHEMSSQSTYFFPPAAEPIHPNIHPRALYWLETFGRGNAAAFDRRGWVYYVGERFDLFYPGYGDSYPSLRGAIGMTYEMAGGGRAGQAVERPDGSTLTLADRIARHLTTSIATATTAIRNRETLLADFAQSRRQSAGGPQVTYLWSADGQEARAAADLLSEHGVEVGVLAEETTLRAQPTTGEPPQSRTFPAGTYAVSTSQPLGSFVRTLMDLDASMSEAFLEEQRRRLEENRRTEFYDITAWSLPLAFNLEAWQSRGAAPATAPLQETTAGATGGSLGFLIRPQGLAGYRMTSALQERGVVFRMAVHPFALDGSDYPSGTLFIPRRGNPDSLETQLEELAREIGVTVEPADSGYAEVGSSLGSDSVVSVRAPRIALVEGEGVSAGSLGALWHLLDQQVRAPHHRIGLSSLASLDLAEIDVLVLPDGRYAAAGEAVAGRVESWIRQGGILVAVGGATGWLQKHSMVSIKSWRPPKQNPKENEIAELTPANRQLYTPGAALATEVRRPHPLTAGVDGSPAALFQGSSILLPTGDPRQDVVVAADDDPVIAGFAWPEAKERLEGSLLVGLERKGRGAVVVFSQEPCFRLFWRGTAPVFLNTVLYGPSLAEHRQLR